MSLFTSGILTGTNLSHPQTRHLHSGFQERIKQIRNWSVNFVFRYLFTAESWRTTLSTIHGILVQTCHNPEGPWDSRLSSLEILVPAGIQRLIHWSVIISRRATCERFKSQKLVLEVLSPIHAASLMAQGRRVPIPLIAYANNSASYAQCSAS